MNVCRTLRGARSAPLAALAVAGAWAQEQQAPTPPAFVLPPPPQYRLEPVPQVDFGGARFAPDDEEAAEVRALVASLTGIDKPDFGLAVVTAVREIWRSDDPARRLMDSLLADFCTRDDTGCASTPLQCGAATRLLYYFPPQSAELVARRIEAFEVRRINVPVQGWAAWEARYAANGVAAEELMRSPTTTVSCSGRATRARTRPMSRPGSLSSMSRT